MRPSPSTATPSPPSSPKSSPPPSPSATSTPATATTPTSTSSSPATTSTAMSSPPHCTTPPTTAASDYVRSAKQSPTCPPGAKPPTPHGDDAKATPPRTTPQPSPTSSPPSPRSLTLWQPMPRADAPGTPPPELGGLDSGSSQKRCSRGLKPTASHCLRRQFCAWRGGRGRVLTPDRPVVGTAVAADAAVQDRCPPAERDVRRSAQHAVARHPQTAAGMAPVIRPSHPAEQHGVAGMQLLAGHFQAGVIRPAERRQVSRAEGSVVRWRLAC